MKSLWTLFWSVCRMQRGPEDFPVSWALLLLMALLDAELGVFTQLLSESAPLSSVLGMTLIGVGGDALVLGGLVLFKGVQQRYVQSLTAIYAADVMLGLLALLLVLAGLHLPGKSWLGVLVFAQMLLVGWNLAVRAFIYFRTLRVGIFQANMLSLTLFLLNIFIVARLFPELLPASAGG